MLKIDHMKYEDILEEIRTRAGSEELEKYMPQSCIAKINRGIDLNGGFEMI